VPVFSEEELGWPLGFFTIPISLTSAELFDLDLLPGNPEAYLETLDGLAIEELYKIHYFIV
jgi:hypothetical protein